MALPVPDLKEKIVVKNLILSYAKLGVPNSKFAANNPTYEVRVTTGDVEVSNLLKAMGAKMTIVQDEESGAINYTTVVKTKSLNTKTSSAMPPPKVIGLNRSAIDPNLIGNGSIGNIAISSYEYTFQGKTGKAINLHAVQITLLKVWHPQDATDLFDDEGETTIVDEGADEELMGDDNDLPY